MSSEIQQRADFSAIRYAQCWEDADVLLSALNISPGDRCLAIASAGDNALAMLAQDPAEVVAVDLNPAQLACLHLRVAGYRELEHPELLELIGSRPSERREQLYRRCRRSLDNPEARAFWDAHPELIDGGIGGAGKFENYFRLFRRRALPWVHGKARVKELLSPRSHTERAAFYDNRWNTWRWNALFRIFFSRTVMGKLGRDPSFFDYVEGSVAERILSRAEHALTELPPDENPYLHWILTGTHGAHLPFALREENFEAIRDNLDALTIRLASVEDILEEGGTKFDAYNLSDIFEYMSEENSQALLRELVAAANPEGRLAYWNMLAPRSRPESMADRLLSHDDLADSLHLEDKAFFYSRFVVEEVAG